MDRNLQFILEAAQKYRLLLSKIFHKKDKIFISRPFKEKIKITTMDIMLLVIDLYIILFINILLKIIENMNYCV
jgi:hypothetical protein